MLQKYVYKGKIYTSEYALRRAIFEAEGKVFTTSPAEDLKEFWSSHNVEYSEEPDPEPTPEQLLAQAKRERAEKVNRIKVTVDGMTFDGDEVSQSRMARALTAALTAGQSSTTWVLADNTVATVSKEQLAEALTKSMLEMSKVWTDPYEGEKQ